MIQKGEEKRRVQEDVSMEGTEEEEEEQKTDVLNIPRFSRQLASHFAVQAVCTSSCC